MARILVVDDNHSMVDYLFKILELQGHTTFKLTNPTQLFYQIEQNPVDLILLDIEMPEMDGLVLLKSIKNNSDYSSIDVIMVTVHADEKVLVKCLEQGAADYITKPVREIEMMARINSALVRKNVENRLASIISALPAISFVLDEEGRYLDVSTSIPQLLFDTIHNLMGRKITDVLSGENA